MRVLCLDIEGGYGGSSRSLYYLLKNLDPTRVVPEVWCRQNGPIVSMYKDSGIRVQVEPALPKVSSLPRLSRNVWAIIKYSIMFTKSYRLRQRLVEVINDRFDVVHFNHEALYLLAAWLRPRVTAAFVMHNRTLITDTCFARYQARLLLSTNDVNVFITERERNNIRRLANCKTAGVVINNAVDVPYKLPIPHPALPTDNLFTIACLSNYSWKRGVDRLIDVALALRSLGRNDIRFVVGGNHQLSGSLPGLLGEIAEQQGSLADYAAARGVSDCFVFLGHVSNPERVLVASHVLLKPSREDNPWGRDILEALAMGLPVLACGTYERFVQPGVTGYLYPHDNNFDPAAVATDIIGLAENAMKRLRMAKNATHHISKLCDGISRANDLVATWESALNETES